MSEASHGERMTAQAAPDYPGVAVETASCRVVVGCARDGAFYYRLQVLAPVLPMQSPRGAWRLGWLAVPGSSAPGRAAFLEKVACVPGLADLVAGLPERPEMATPAIASYYE